MKKNFIISLLMLVFASPFVNAVTFKKYSSERAFYMPDLSSDFDGTAYELHTYEIEFPTDGSSLLKAIILYEVFG